MAPTVDDFFSTDTGSSTTGTTTLVLTVPRAVASGKKLVLAHGRADVSGSTIVGLTSVTDSKGNTWTVNDAISIRANQGGVAFAHCAVTTALAAGDTITATLSATASRKFMDVWVCSGLATGARNATSGTTATANTNSGANGASNTPTVSLTTTAANCLIFTAAYLGASGVPVTAGSGYTLDSTRATTDTAPKGWSSEHGTAAASGAKTASVSASSSSAWAMAAVAFAPVANTPPTANAGVDQNSVQPASTVQLDGTASTDPDGFIASYAWTQTGGVTCTLSNAHVANPTYQAPGTLTGDTQTWQLTVTDNLGATSTDTVSITVLVAAEQIMLAGGWTPGKLALITADPTTGGGGGGPVVAGDLSMTVTGEPTATPPRIRVDISDTRTPPANQLVLTRRNPDGHTYPVRTSDGGPLPLSGGQATIYDYEPPYDAPLTFGSDQPGTASVASELFVDDVWLVHPGVPSLSQKLHVTALDDRTRDTGRTLYQILAREDPIPVSSGARPASAATLGLRTYTEQQRQALDLLLADDSPLLLNIPAALPWGWTASYVSCGQLSEKRTVRYGRFPYREWTLPIQVVGRPGGGTQAAITWGDDAAQYPTWQSIVDAGVTSWAELAAPTTS